MPLRRGVAGRNVDVADAAVEDVPVEGALELGAVVGLDHFDLEWELLQHVVEERDRGLLVVAWVDPKHSDAVQSSIAVYW